MLPSGNIQLVAYAGVRPDGRPTKISKTIPADSSRVARNRAWTELLGQADRLAVARRQRRQQGGYVELDGHRPGDRLVGEVLEAWWAHGSARRTDLTKQFDRSALDRYLLPHLGDLRLWQLRTVLTASEADHDPDLCDLTAFFERLAACGAVGRPGAEGKKTGAGGPLSPDYVKRIHGVLRTALGWTATQWPRDLPDNPAANVALPSSTVRDSTTPLKAQVAKLVPFIAESHPTLAAFSVLVGSGPRPQEVSAITRWQLDLEARTVELLGSGVVREYDTAGHERWVLVEGETRKRRKRKITLDDNAAGLLATHLTKMDQLASQAGCTLGPGSFVFSSLPDGSEPLSPHAMGGRFSKYVQRAIDSGIDLPRGMRLYDMRHYGITTMLRAGRPLAQVAYRFATSERMIHQRYSHAVPADDASLAGSMEGAWGF